MYEMNEKWLRPAVRIKKQSQYLHLFAGESSVKTGPATHTLAGTNRQSDRPTNRQADKN